MLICLLRDDELPPTFESNLLARLLLCCAMTSYLICTQRYEVLNKGWTCIYSVDGAIDFSFEKVPYELTDLIVAWAFKFLFHTDKVFMLFYKVRASYLGTKASISSDPFNIKKIRQNNRNWVYNENITDFVCEKCHSIFTSSHKTTALFIAEE